MSLTENLRNCRPKDQRRHQRAAAAAFADAAAAARAVEVFAWQHPNHAR